MKLLNSFKYAFQGIYTAFKRERNMKIHYFIMCLVILFGFIYKISILEWMICLICFAIVIASEMINTALELAIDLSTPEKNFKAKQAKDIAAGAVLIMAIVSSVIGLLIFFPKMF